jgi:hypothetical protein
MTRMPIAVGAVVRTFVVGDLGESGVVTGTVTASFPDYPGQWHLRTATGELWGFFTRQVQAVIDLAPPVAGIVPPRYPAGTPEHTAYAAELRTELNKFAAGEEPYSYTTSGMWEMP